MKGHQVRSNKNGILPSVFSYLRSVDYISKQEPEPNFAALYATRNFRFKFLLIRGMGVEEKESVTFGTGPEVRP